ncbi:hypothetical protein BH09PLA1_BH09PLA1_32270 [soil metagenome]
MSRPQVTSWPDLHRAEIHFRRCLEKLPWNGGGGKVCIEVRDTGIGIEPGNLHRIFDPFEQGSPNVHRQFGGMGLGLAISRSIIDMHEGTICASSDDGGIGATFRVELTALEELYDSAISPAQSSPRTAPALRARVLLVEDHTDTACVLARLLRKAGYQVQTAANVAAALELAGREKFDVVISDIGLPDASGYELIARLSERGPCRGVAMSGYGTEADIERSRSAGFIRHLVKPVQLAELEDAIERAMAD